MPHDVENVVNAAFYVVLQDRGCHLDAAQGVAGHPVRRSNVVACCIAVAENINTAVFEEAPDDADDVHIVGQAGHAPAQTADTAHNHFDLHARLTRLDELVNQHLVRQAVHFQADQPLLPRLRLADFAVNHVNQLILQAVRRDQQHGHVVYCFAQHQRLENLQCLFADFVARGDVAQVGIQAAGLLVVVARADLRDVLDAFIRFARNQAKFGMNLQFIHTVDNVAACALQTAAPLDVVLLVKAGFQLHQHVHLLAVFGSLHQRFHNLRVAREAVERHADGDDLRVIRRFGQHSQERTDTLVRVVQQHILFQNLLHHRAIVHDIRRCLRMTRRVEQFRVAAQFILNIKQEANIQRRIVLVDARGVQFQLVAQLLDNVVPDFSAEFQTHRAEFLAQAHDFRHVVAIVEVFVVYAVRVNVGAAGNARKRLACDAVAAKKQRQIVQNQLFREDIAARALRHLNQAREHVLPARNDADFFLLAARAQDGDGINLLVFEERERLLFAHDISREQWQIVLAEDFRQILLAFRADLAEVDDADALVLQLL